MLPYALNSKHYRYIKISADHKSASDSNNVFTPQPEEDTVVSKQLALLECTATCKNEVPEEEQFLLNGIGG